MTYIGGLVAVVLLVIGLIHLLWGSRIYWPCRDEKTLARTVVGVANVAAMPAPYQCHFATFAAFIAGVDALFLGRVLGPGVVAGWLILAIGCACCLVLLLRGVAGFAPVWARLTPEQPFRTLDKRYYAPLCLLLGAGFAVLIWAFIRV